MSNDLKTIDLNILPLETLAEMANEAAEQAEKNAKLTVQKAIDAGRYLTAAKEQIEYGKWLVWLGKNWNYKPRYAQSCMSLSNAQHVAHLSQAANWREALRIIADEKADPEPESVPRSERITGRVEVTEPESVTNDESPEPDDDPTPDPPTIRTTPAGTTKAREADRTPPAPITPEILPDEPEDGAVMLRESDVDGIREMFRRCVLVDEGDLKFVVESLIRKTENKHGHKKLAGVLRKWVNELDPPTKFVKPTIEEVTEYCVERKNGIDPEGFIAYYAKMNWKTKDGVKITDWKAAVITWEKRDKEKGNSNGSGTGTTQDPASCLGPNGRPRVERAKITYK